MTGGNGSKRLLTGAGDKTSELENDRRSKMERARYEVSSADLAAEAAIRLPRVNRPSP